MATIGNYRRHVMELRGIIKATGENTNELITQSKELEKVIEYYDCKNGEHWIDVELVGKLDNVKNDLQAIVEKSVEQHKKLFEAYDRLIDDLLKE